MDELKLLTALHKAGYRQAPGGDEETRLAITLSGLRGYSNLQIADIGCGTGASTRILASELNALVTAVDVLPDFVSKLASLAAEQGLGDRIETLTAPMEDLPFEKESLDAIWSEGAIYNMGFSAGVRAWRRLLKPGGILAVSELTWLTAQRPEDLSAHWMREYPEVGTAGEKLSVLENSGYAPMGYFTLPVACWLENYYRPMQARFPEFLERFDHAEEARALVAAEEQEIALYERYREFVSYGYYVAKKVGD
jgi:SAM-dependent methyltransferase